jgi:hypothetical protein
VGIYGRDMFQILQKKGIPTKVISMQFLLRDMIPTGYSSGTPGGQTGATINGCGYLPFSDWN